LAGNSSSVAPSPNKLKLPRITKVQLKSFSLFAANPNAAFTANSGVLCLVGANGIGKSTLLSAINYCLTGTVPDPTRVFESVEEYYKYTRTYSASYFRGRIAGTDEDDAEVSVTFNIGGVKFEITRGMFEPEGRTTPALH
jgi:DNA repair exonuclease SbcCD ATPase subunit